jgi:anti-sigma regulatory factor (Ser/Thr protein kinase)
MPPRAIPAPPGGVAAIPLRACAFCFPGRGDQVRYARAFIRRFLDGHPAADDAILLVSELAANACAHSASGRPGGTYTVRARVGDGGRVQVEVEDEGSSWGGSLMGIESPHGLYLVRSLAAACGTRRGARGWVIWFVLGRP